ncbi:MULTISPECIES: MucR family transcriptional regulator [unclassified Methylobacterium]|uniref:MucR family transcriptional regulator n=1 Tax=unclassified Methylobacterium TaxID=2615210 RepID=UPI001FB86DC6|nr:MULTISPECIES: MucR family transcriptional regulator [unclassified Methylobacterium]MCJ2019369.1 MucR family transcriptional regulator [Methylobacterium sp. E-065]
MDDNAPEQQQTFIEQASDIVSAYVSNNSVPISELPGLLAGVHAALAKLSAPTAAVTEAADKPTPAQIRKSVTPDALVSFIDGKPYKTLKRHLSRNGLTIEQYRERFGLPRDYPSTAASYSAQRSELARSLGLGQQRRKSVAVEEPVEEVAEKPKRASKPRKAKETA